MKVLKKLASGKKLKGSLGVLALGIVYAIIYDVGVFDAVKEVSPCVLPADIDKNV